MYNSGEAVSQREETFQSRRERIPSVCESDNVEIFVRQTTVEFILNISFITSLRKRTVIILIFPSLLLQYIKNNFISKLKLK